MPYPESILTIPEMPEEETPKDESIPEEPGDVETPAEGEGEEPAEPKSEPEPKKDEEEEEEPEIDPDAARPGNVLIQQIKTVQGGKFKEVLDAIPDLRNAISRGYAYTRLFGDMDSARNALEDAEAFREFESQLISGDPGGMLASLKQTNADSYKELTQNFLPTLYKNDQDAFASVITPVVANASATMYRAGQANNNKNMMNSALFAAHYFFGKYEVPPLTPMEPRKDPNREKLTQEREGFLKERYESVRDEVATELDQALSQMIDSALSAHGVSSYQKNLMIRGIIEEATGKLGGDADFQRMMTRIWNESKTHGFKPAQTKPRIRSAYLARVKSMVPSLVRKHVREAGLDKKERPAGPEKKQLTGGAPAPGTMKRLDPKNVNWDKTTTADIFAGRATLKG